MIKKIEKMNKEELLEEYKKLINFSNTDVSNTEEALAKAIVSLSDKDNPEVMTHLTDPEIKKLSSLSAIAHIWDMKFVDVWIKNFLIYRISYERKGRKEIVDVAKRPKLENLGNMSRLFGKQ